MPRLRAVFLAPGYLLSEASEAAAWADADDCLNAMAAGVGDPAATVRLAKAYLANGHKFFRIGPAAGDNLFEPRKAVCRLLAQLHTVRDAVGDQLVGVGSYFQLRP